MAQLNQSPGTQLLDVSVHNYGGSQLNAGSAVIMDTSNTGTQALAPGVTLPASNVKGIGFLVDNIPAGRTGRMRVYGIAVALPTVGVSFNPGDPLMCDSSGFVLAQTAGLYQIGIAFSAAATAVAGDTCLVLIDRAKNA